MVDESFDTKFANEIPKPYEFRARPVWQKVIVICAGVAMNLLLAWAIFWGANFFEAKQVTKTTSIAYVEPNTAADSAGFKTGDRILSINNKKTSNWEDVLEQIFINTLGQNLNIKIKRNNDFVDLKIPRKKIPDTESAQMLYLIPEGGRSIVSEVKPHTPAEQSKLKAGDILLLIKNKPVFTRAQAVEIFSSNKGIELPLLILRGKDTTNLAVTPGNDGKIGAMIGEIFTGPSEFKTYGFFTSIYMGYSDIVKYTDLTFNMLGKVFKGEIAFGKAFGGPIKIAQAANTYARLGIGSFLYFLALLSLTLAIINIMPFPVLDGGHLIIIFIEGITKKEIPVKVKVGIQNAGFVILLLLMAFIIYNDILSL